MTNPGENGTGLGNEAQEATFGVAASEIAERAQRLNENQTLALMHDYLGQLDGAASRGELKDREGEPYTPDDLNAQFQSFIEDIKKSDQDPAKDYLKRIPRAMQLRAGVTTFLDNPKTARPFMDALKYKLSVAEEGKLYEPGTSAVVETFGAPSLRRAAQEVVGLQPEAQEVQENHAELVAEVAPELAKEAIEDAADPILAESAPSQPEVVDPFDELPPDVQNDVRYYRQLVQDKKDSEREKNFAQAADDGRSIYAQQVRMSAQARAFLGLKDQ